MEYFEVGHQKFFSGSGIKSSRSMLMGSDYVDGTGSTTLEDVDGIGYIAADDVIGVEFIRSDID